jgi:hypothetical protein
LLDLLELVPPLLAVVVLTHKPRRAETKLVLEESQLVASVELTNIIPPTKPLVAVAVLEETVALQALPLQEPEAQVRRQPSWVRP